MEGCNFDRLPSSDVAEPRSSGSAARTNGQGWQSSAVTMASVRGSSLHPEPAALQLDEAERRRVLLEFNATTAEFAADRVVHQLFEDQVARTPNQTAVIHGERQLSFAQINMRANQFARYLVNQGAGPDKLVGICVGRSVELVVAVLGVLKAGAAYLPLDPNYPTDRLQNMVSDSKPIALFTQTELLTILPGNAVAVDILNSRLRDVAFHIGEDLSAAELGMSSRDLVYVIYTSGSTGRPKGTAMSHRSMVNLIEWQRSIFGSAEGRRVLQFAALSFDVAFQEIFTTLCTGGTLVLLDEWVRRDVRALMQLLQSRSIHRLFLPPMMLQSLAEHTRSSGEVPAALQDVICAGEQLRISAEIREFFKKLPQCRLHNHYGPTETHVVTALTLSADPQCWPVLPDIGRPISNTQIYILDEQRRPVPIGVAGEIYIGGVGVAREYLHRPELTAQRFVLDPYSDEAGARLYRTGDLGRWRPDGHIEYLGRADDQVKVRGYRIELGEIAAQLSRYEKVKEAVVLAREDVPGDKRLVAYVVPRDTDVVLSIEELRTHLSLVLPEFMLPSAFVLLKELPLSPNGKLDRKALPSPTHEAYLRQDYEAPMGEVETLLAAIWQELLHLDRVGRHDNFFELGGHSVVIVRMLGRLHQAGWHSTAQLVYQRPVLNVLAASLTARSGAQPTIPPNLIPEGTDRITPDMLPLVALSQEDIDRIAAQVPGGAANIKDIYPLAPLQEGILFHHVIAEEHSDTYVLPTLLSLESRDKLHRFLAALHTVIESHDVLRTAILWEQLPRPIQVVYRHAELQVEELELNTNREPLEQLREMLQPEYQRLDLHRAPLMQVQVAKHSSSARYFALIRLHHLICDQDAVDQMLEEVAAQLDGRPYHRPNGSAYRDHVARALQSVEASDAKRFFTEKLGDVSEATVPFALMDVQLQASRIRRATKSMERDLSDRVRAAARRIRTTPAILFHAVWAVVLSRISRREDVVFGTLLLGRSQDDQGGQRAVGMFINTLPIRFRLLDITVSDLIEQARRETAELLAYEQTSLAMAQRCSGVGDRGPLFAALLNYRHPRVGSAGASSVNRGITSVAQGIEIVEKLEWTNYPLTLSVDDTVDGLDLVVDVDLTIDPQRVIGYVEAAMQSVLTALERAPKAAVRDVEILAQGERHQVLESFNETGCELQISRQIHTLFEVQAMHTPEAVAITHNGCEVSYRQLNDRANRLARYLLGCGIAPGSIAAICMSRGLNMVVGLLAILKAGGAYLPVDPSYPAERIAQMLADAEPYVAITDSDVAEVLPELKCRIIAVDQIEGAVQSYIGEELSAAELGMSSRDLVYVIYTSGSTGRPKGTAMSHRSMVNLIEWQRSIFGGAEGKRVLQFAALSFDVAFQEIFTTLCTGGTLVLLDEWVRRDVRALTELLQSCSIERLFLPPLMLQSLAEHTRSTGEVPAALQDVICAGEQLRISTEIREFFKKLPQCRLHNHYGPTETHVVTALTLSADPQQWPALPDIGRPIANTQIYILDEQRRPVPIGVAGEIYIGGVGVAREYLHRPELTAQRFVLDPYSREPGARLYRTGDLGRWRADGHIEYLGRADDQVKIRGYRIELGEIAAQLSRYEKVKEAAVLAREDTPGDKRLVAYIVPRDAAVLSIQELRIHLRALLPEFMLPGAFVLLERLPLSPNGKLDRKALPAPTLDAYARQDYEAPVGEPETLLAAIWQELLRVDRVGRHDNFFELGGHSLLALRALTPINARCAANIKVTDLYQNPTVHELASCILRGRTDDPLIELRREATLDPSIAAASAAQSRAGGIMLTGATGFVGRFLLAQLLNQTNAKVYCLVRASSGTQALHRLKQTLTKWNLWRTEWEGRIVAICGDLRLPRLGLDEADYEMLSREIATIYHCGTSMNHLETYAAAKPANVESAREILRLATLEREKVVNYVSTLGVFSDVPTDGVRVVDELSAIDRESHRNSSGYLASKWVAEKIFMTAQARGIPCNIFRLGLVWADTARGRFDEAQHLHRLIKTCLLSGYAIQEYRFEMAPTAVDYVACAMAHLGQRHVRGADAFHLTSPYQFPGGVFERCNEIMGTSLKLLPYFQWVLQMKRLHLQGQSMPIVPLIEFSFSMDEESFYRQQRDLPWVRIAFDCNRTLSELQRAGIFVPALNDDLLRICVEDMAARERLPARDERLFMQSQQGDVRSILLERRIT